MVNVWAWIARATCALSFACTVDAGLTISSSQNTSAIVAGAERCTARGLRDPNVRSFTTAFADLQLLPSDDKAAFCAGERVSNASIGIVAGKIVELQVFLNVCPGSYVRPLNMQKTAVANDAILLYDGTRVDCLSLL